MELLSSAAEAVPEGEAGPVGHYFAEKAAALAHQCQPSFLEDHLAVDPCGPEHLSLPLEAVMASPGVLPSLQAPGVPYSSVDFDLVDVESEEGSSWQQPGLLVSVVPSSFEHQPPVESS